MGVKFVDETPGPRTLPADLRRLLHASEGQGELPPRRLKPLMTGWESVDRELGRRRFEGAGSDGLARGVVHEWLGCEGVGPRDWSPPLSLLVHLAWGALAPSEESPGPAMAVWVGRRVWPYPRVLVRDFRVDCSTSDEALGGAAIWRLGLVRIAHAERSVDPQWLLRHTLFVDPKNAAQRLWAIDSALRCSAVGVVVADASGLDMAASRRLQLAAGAGEGLGLFARPPREERALSAAATRWRVQRSVPSRERPGPGWTLELLRCKGVGACVGERS